MDKLGGLAAVIKELEDIESEIRTTSAWVLGKASQNNALVQNQVSYYFLLVYLAMILDRRPRTNRKFPLLVFTENYSCIGKLGSTAIVENAISDMLVNALMDLVQ